MRIVALALVSLLAQQAAPTPPQRPPLTLPTGNAEVRGDLVDAKSGMPVEGATVQLVPMTGQPIRPRSATSDAQGKFVFTAVPAGRYGLSVRRPASLTNALTGATRTIDVADEARLTLGTLRLPSFSDISGQILDEHGKPLARATVTASRLTYLTPGERRLFTEGTATTDAAGDFRIVGVKPGSYYVEARSSDKQAPTFYPGSTSAAMAQPVVVTEDVGAIVSIQLMPAPLARIAGTVVNSQGAPGSEFVVLIAPVRDDGAQVRLDMPFSEVDGAGKFSIDKVPPGVYSLNVAAKARLERLAQTGSSGVGSRVENEESASQQVVVDGRNIDDVMLRTTPLTQLAGKVTVDGAGMPAELAKTLNIVALGRSAADAMGSVFSTTYGQPAADGAFTMPVVPGGRLMRVLGVPRGTVLKQVLVNGVDVTDEGFDVGGTGARDVVVALTSKPARVDGHVINGQGAMLANVGVIVFPEESRRWSLPQTRMVMSAKTDKDGAFSVAALPAGNYFVAVVPQLVDGEWAAPTNLEKLRMTATPFKIGDGEQKTLTLTIR